MKDYEHLLEPGKTVLVDEYQNRHLLLSDRVCLQFDGTHAINFVGQGWDSLEDIPPIVEIYHLNPNGDYFSFTTSDKRCPLKLVWSAT